MKKSELKEMIKAEMMAEVQYDIDDTNADYDFLAEEYEATSYDIQIGPAMVGMVNIRKYLQNQPQNI
jgi:Tfp pilus assembly PilM family ATPase